ncbi:hypothetical protein ACMD2_06865 [Ananas comosus]|uniref:Uncharacterized protein n=1 Tax=Ananas comosus TaxID=4615 RepID=A0A199W756_ANACO|nr:hypothetical protein ACMD2_06865 [Ananas comosus]
MGSLSSLGVGLTLVSSFLFLALMAELYYLFWWKKRRSNRDTEDTHATPAEALLHLCFWKKPSSLTSTALNPQEIHHHPSANGTERSNEAQLHLALKSYGGAGEESVEAELMRLHGLAGPPRFLFTIKEETKEDLESEDGRSRGGRSRKGGKSLSELLHSAETPFLTPLSSPPFFTPPLTPLDSYKQHGFNPLFESSSPPPKFQFLKDAEEKLYRRTLMEQALKQEASSVVSLPSPLGREEEDASFITIVIGKNRERGHQHQQHQHHYHHSSSSQVLPLPSSPSKIRTTTKMGKSISHTGSTD